MGGFFMKLKIINCLLLLISFFVSIMIFLNKSIDLTVIENLFLSMTSHMKLEKDHNVSAINYYNHLSLDKYNNEYYEVFFPYEAIVH